MFFVRYIIFFVFFNMFGAAASEVSDSPWGDGICVIGNAGEVVNIISLELLKSKFDFFNQPVESCERSRRLILREKYLRPLMNPSSEIDQNAMSAHDILETILLADTLKIRLDRESIIFLSGLFCHLFDKDPVLCNQYFNSLCATNSLYCTFCKEICAHVIRLLQKKEINKRSFEEMQGEDACLSDGFVEACLNRLNLHKNVKIFYLRNVRGFSIIDREIVPLFENYEKEDDSDSGAGSVSSGPIIIRCKKDRIASLNGIDQLEEANVVDKMYIDNNRIRHIPESIFTRYQNLKILSLSGNILQQLQTRSFEGLSCLTHLDLSKNRLQLISKEHLQWLGALHTLNISGNNISFFEPDVFQHCPLLKILNISDNPLSKGFLIPVSSGSTVLIGRTQSLEVSDGCKMRYVS